MKNRLPRRQELLILLALSVVCTLVVRITGKYDMALAFTGAPIFLVAALMGLRRHGQLTTEAEAPEVEPAEAEAPGVTDDAAA